MISLRWVSVLQRSALFFSAVGAESSPQTRTQWQDNSVHSASRGSRKLAKSQAEPCVLGTLCSPDGALRLIGTKMRLKLLKVKCKLMRSKGPTLNLLKSKRASQLMSRIFGSSAKYLQWQKSKCTNNSAL